MCDNAINTVIPYNYFTWVPDSAILVSEISSMAGLGLTMPQEFSIHNERTGNTRHFRFVNRRVDAEGEVVCWNYISTSVPAIAVSIYND